jgi:hypothetical protein
MKKRHSFQALATLIAVNILEIIVLRISEIGQAVLAVLRIVTLGCSLLLASQNEPQSRDTIRNDFFV